MMDGAPTGLSLSSFSSLSLLHPDMSRWFIFGLFPAIDCHWALSIAYICSLFLYCQTVCFLVLFPSHLLSLSVIPLLSNHTGCPLLLPLHSEWPNINGHKNSKAPPLISTFYSFFIVLAKFCFSLWMWSPKKGDFSDWIGCVDFLLKHFFTSAFPPFHFPAHFMTHRTTLHHSELIELYFNTDLR